MRVGVCSDIRIIGTRMLGSMSVLLLVDLLFVVFFECVMNVR